MSYYANIGRDPVYAFYFLSPQYGSRNNFKTNDASDPFLQDQRAVRQPPKYFYPKIAEVEGTHAFGAKLGCVDSMVWLGSYYYTRNNSTDKNQAQIQFQKGAKAGHPEALFPLGLMLSLGQGIEFDQGQKVGKDHLILAAHYMNAAKISLPQLRFKNSHLKDLFVTFIKSIKDDDVIYQLFREDLIPADLYSKIEMKRLKAGIFNTLSAIPSFEDKKMAVENALVKGSPIRRALSHSRLLRPAHEKRGTLRKLNLLKDILNISTLPELLDALKTRKDKDDLLKVLLNDQQEFKRFFAKYEKNKLKLLHPKFGKLIDKAYQQFAAAQSAAAMQSSLSSPATSSSQPAAIVHINTVMEEIKIGQTLPPPPVSSYSSLNLSNANQADEFGYISTLSNCDRIKALLLWLEDAKFLGTFEQVSEKLFSLFGEEFRSALDSNLSPLDQFDKLVWLADCASLYREYNLDSKVLSIMVTDALLKVESELETNPKFIKAIDPETKRTRYFPVPNENQKIENATPQSNSQLVDCGFFSTQSKSTVQTQPVPPALNSSRTPG